MIANITNYFTNLNNTGQALFVIGILLVITFIVLLIIVLKPEKNKVKKIYGENALTDRENIFEEKMKDIDHIGVDDINIENDRTRNLKNIVDELKHLESKNVPTMMDRIEAYEDEQEDTAIISVEELLKSNKPVTYAKKNNLEFTEVYEKPIVQQPKKKEVEEEYLFIEDISEVKPKETIKIVETQPKYQPRREIFSSVYTEPQKEVQNNEAFLNNLKEFRNNL